MVLDPLQRGPKSHKQLTHKKRWVVTQPARQLLFFILLWVGLSTSANAATPAITSLNPNSGAIGASVTITGSAFGSTQGSSTVTFNGTRATTISSWSTSSIVAIVPSGATTGNVVVTVAGKASNGVSFTVLPSPAITGVSPASGAVGAVVTISGNNFGSPGSVTFNGTQASVNSWSATSIAAVVPSGATTGNIVVFTSGVNSNGVSFTVWPSLSGISPNAGPVGASITLTGLNFGSSQAGNSVTFNNVAASITNWNSSSITAIVPPGLANGNVSVVITVGGNSSNALTFLVGTISTTTYHLDQGAGVSGKFLLTTAAPNTASTSVQSADLKGSPANGVALVGTFTTLTGIAGTVPSGSTVTFSVWMNETAAVGGIFPYLVLQFQNAIFQVGEVCRQLGTNALTTTLTKFQFTCTAPGNVTIRSDQPFWLYVQVNWPSTSISRSVKAQVFFDGTPNGNFDSWISVPEIITPVLAGISPTTGAPGTSVTINGSLFGANQGTGTVSIGGLNAPVTSWSDAQIVATAPCASGPVIVTASGNQSINSYNFLEPLPVITSPPAAASAGSPVTIGGSNFLQPPCVTTTLFNGVNSTPTSVSATQIVAPVPSGLAQASLTVAVGSLISSPVSFVVLGTLGGTVTDAGNGNPVNGASVQVLQSNRTVATTTTAANGSYNVANLQSGTYDVRFSASGYGTAIAPANSVVYGSSTVVNASLALPGTISGQVTQSGGNVAISGATVVAALASSSAGSATTDVNGNYSISTLAPGSYTVVASATGFVPSTVGTVSVSSGNTTTENLGLQQGSSQSVISYFYDELGRLIGVSDSQGNTATYNYDAAGNLLSISVNPTSQVSVVGFDPVHGPVGTSVTVSGTGFSSTANQNTVTFNGTAATVVSATSTQLVVTVPTGATTGTIRIVTSGGSATSSSSFTIP
jgi:YD repeat-containing protein